MSRFILVRESCAGRREAVGEALTAVRVGRAMEHRKPSSECRGFSNGRRQHGRSRYRLGAARLRGVGEPKARTYDQCRDLGGIPVVVTSMPLRPIDSRPTQDPFAPIQHGPRR